MRTFRKVVLPAVWVAIFAVIAVSLAVMAFGNESKSADSGLKPTGEIPISNTVVSRATVENDLTVTGSIAVDPPVSEKATHDGVINHQFVPAGAKVKKGDPIFQIKSEGADTQLGETDEDAEEDPKPRPRYHTVVASKAGKVDSFAKDVGDSVAKGDVVATVTRTTFRATGSIKPVELYRLLKMPKSATVTITGGPAPFKCGDLAIGGPADTGTPVEEDEEFIPGEDMGGGGAEGNGGGGTTISCRVPDDVKVFDGLAMTMSIDAGRAEDVLVVPVTAVRGLVDSGTVWVLDDGRPTERKVELGLSDGTVIEVTKGLKEGEAVLEFVPGSTPGSKGRSGKAGSVVRIGR